MQIRRIKDWIILSTIQLFASVFCPTPSAAQFSAASTGLTNIFAPDATPAKSAFDLSIFVLAIIGIICVVVFTVLVYSLVKLPTACTDHSFWIPQLGGKTDLIPNHPNAMWMDPQRPGIFQGDFNYEHTACDRFPDITRI